MATVPRRNARCDGLVRRDSVLCLIRLPARNPHAGQDEIPTRARRFISLRAPVTDGPLGLPRVIARRVGRETRSQPPDATSIATERDSRNPPTPEAIFVPGRLAIWPRSSPNPISRFRHSQPPRQRGKAARQLV